MLARGLTLVAIVLLMLAPPPSIAIAGGGGFHGASRDGNHGRGFGVHRSGCCFGPVAVGRAFLGLAIAEPTYASPFPVYAELSEGPAPAPAHPSAVTPAAPPVFCHFGGCYHLHGNGVTVPYEWTWVAAAPGSPPAPPPLPAGVR